MRRKLIALVRPLPIVGGPPIGRAAPDHVAGVDDGAPVHPELFEGLLEDLLADAHTRSQLGDGRTLQRNRALNLGDHVGRGVVALEEELVRLRVDVRVKQDRARRRAVTPGASDLLVVALHRRGQRGMQDGANVGLVDAHAERRRGDDRVELASEK